jgi:hypothetical protein
LDVQFKVSGRSVIAARQIFPRKTANLQPGC